MKKKIMAAVLTAAMALSLCACGAKEEVTITGSADLLGKTIGVQLGTTGDQLATEYEAEGATVERYNKGADAIQALKQGKVD